MPNPKEDKELMNAMCNLAKAGHPAAIQFLKEKFHLKVYTQEELNILNKQTTLDLTKENLI